MEKLIAIDEAGRIVLPKAIREAVNLGKGGSAKVRLAPRGIIEIEPVPSARRRLQAVGQFLVSVTDGKKRYDASKDVRAERHLR